jgi:hypothetical protein
MALDLRKRNRGTSRRIEDASGLRDGHQQAEGFWADLRRKLHRRDWYEKRKGCADNEDEDQNDGADNDDDDNNDDGGDQDEDDGGDDESRSRRRSRKEKCVRPAKLLTQTRPLPPPAAIRTSGTVPTSFFATALISAPPAITEFPVPVLNSVESQVQPAFTTPISYLAPPTVLASVMSAATGFANIVPSPSVRIAGNGVASKTALGATGATDAPQNDYSGYQMAAAKKNGLIAFGIVCEFSSYALPLS